MLGSLLMNLIYPWGFGHEVPISLSAYDAIAGRPLFRLMGRKTQVIYNGIDESLFDFGTLGSTPRQVSLSGISGDIPNIGIVGRLMTQKGHSYFLQAAKRVLMSVPAAFVVVGAGPLESDLRRQADELGIAEAVRFLGSRGDVYDIMLDLDVLVSSSLWEGLPTVILEAMALGVPVVATDVSGSREIVRSGSTGHLVPVEDAEQLALAILDVLSAPEPAAVMAHNAQVAARRFTIQQATLRYEQLYKEELAGRIW